LLPDQSPEAVQLVASVELQVRVEEAPLATLVGLAVSVTVGEGGGGAVTVTVAVLLSLPPAPLQVSVKSVVATNVPVDALPLVAIVPDHPPEAVQPVAFVELHVKVEAEPATMLAGFAVSVTIGAGAELTVTVTISMALAPTPEHMSV
jgi:hypothetical protein